MRKNENVIAIMQSKYAAVASAAEVITNMTNDWQLIKQYLHNRMQLNELTEGQQKKLERYNFIYSHLLADKYGKQEVITMTMKFFDLAIRQIYEDFNCVQEIYPSVVTINKTFELQIELESAKEMKRKAMAAFDFKAAAAFQRNIIELQKLIPEKENTPGEFFEGHTIEAVFDPRLLGAPAVDMNEVLKALNAKRKIPIKIDMFEELEVK